MAGVLAGKALAVGLAVAFVGLLVGPLEAASAPSAYIVRADTVAVDADGNGLFDYLNVTVALSPPQPGSYLVAATLRWPATGTTVASASATVVLGTTNISQLTLRVDGPTVADKQLDGPYNLTVALISSPSGPVHEEASFATPAFHAADFERSAPGDRPRLRVGSDTVQLTSPAINASVNLTRPAVRWGKAAAAGEAGATPRFEATFPRLVAFADGGDHAFEAAEEVCAADLAQGNWSITALEVGPSADLGSYIRFTLGSAVTFAGAACAPGVGGALRLSFLITERNGTVDGATPVAILGGLEVKVDMELTLGRPLTASDLAFEVDLRDLDNATDFVVRGPTGYEALDPAQGAKPVERLAAGEPSDEERVAFVDGAGAPQGHFAWLALGAENLSGGSQRFVQVSASRGLGGGALQLYLAAPNDAQLSRLLLDPVVGVPPHAEPPAGGTPPPSPAEPRPSFLVFVAALAAVAAMFFFSVYARAKKY